jgi:elongation factor P hydroxylase
MEPFTEPLEPSNSLSINFSEKDLIEIYNHVPQVLLNKIIKVSITENDPLFLRGERNGNYWVIKTELGIYWLLPKANFKINIHNINTVKYWFDCQGYQPDDSKEFTVSKLAQVSVVPNKQQWKLEVKGGLNFGNQSLSSQLKLELEQIKEEYKQLQSQLNQSTLECFDFQCQVKKLYQERELLLSKLEQTEKYQQEVFSHLVTREELQKLMQEAAEHFEVRTEYLFENKIQNLLKTLNYEILRIEKRINIDTILKEFSELKNELENKIEKQLPTMETFLVKNLSELENKIEKQLSPLVNADSLVNYSDSESWDDLALPPKTPSTPDPAKPNPVSLNQSEQYKSTEDKQISDLYSPSQNLKHSYPKITQSYQGSPLNQPQSPLANTNLSLTESQLIQEYNSNHKALLKKVIEVNVNENSLNKNRMGSNQPIALEPTRNGASWVWESKGVYYLIPKYSLRINQYNFETIKYLFNCEGYPSNSQGFKLLKPAQVYSSDGGIKWQVSQLGILQFY